MEIIRVIRDLFLEFFGSESWVTWIVVLKALCGAPMIAAEVQRYQDITDRSTVPKTLRELWMVV